MIGISSPSTNAERRHLFVGGRGGPRQRLLTARAHTGLLLVTGLLGLAASGCGATVAAGTGSTAAAAVANLAMIGV